MQPGTSVQLFTACPAIAQKRRHGQKKLTMQALCQKPLTIKVIKDIPNSANSNVMQAAGPNVSQVVEENCWVSLSL